MKVKIEFIIGFKKPENECSLAVMLPACEFETSADYLKGCIEFANHAKLCVVTAPFIAEGFRCVALICEGKVWVQHMCFLSENDKSLYKAGSKVEIIEMPFGKLALCCAEDVFQPQYARLAALSGCTLMVSSIWQLNEAYLMAGPWSAAQANCMPVCTAQSGKVTLILPCELTHDLSGIGESEFNTEDLKAAYKSFPIFQSLNAKLYKPCAEALIK